ncbi:hypothetical protein CBW65_11455 [Tumebacillus avium]|uniref:DUF3307 domain-containing protein n=1 Tax=Tumebacillus avium TaxID=1903704 RepID=A0A1Y0IM20_9BACL|nr:hypothetical protein [Tumebacillus avium]ARU61558.1 hypothetical protein CBW65_11455 [Tumebacillus avium]
MVVLSLLLSYLLAEFYFISEKKLVGLFKCVILTLTPLVIWYFCFDSKFLFSVLYAALFLTFCHVVIDWIFSKLEKSRMLFGERKIESLKTKKMTLFVLEQSAHTVSVLLTSYWFLYIDLWEVWRKISVRFNIAPGTKFELSSVSSILAIIIIFIGVTKISGHIVRILVGEAPTREHFIEEKLTLENSWKRSIVYPTEYKTTTEWSIVPLTKSRINQGGYIGYVERLIVMILAYYSAFPAIAFIATAKSLTRFKQLEDRDFAEYFLVGTLSSILLGIVSGIFLRLVFR